MSTILTILYVVAAGEMGTADELHLPTGNVNTQFQNIVNIVYMIAAIVAVIVIIIAGIQYSLSNGNAQTVSKAKNAIIYSVVGLVIVASAFMITNFVLWRMG